MSTAVIMKLLWFHCISYEKRNPAQRIKPLKMPTSGTGGKIRRPPNAFIIFGNEWRQKLAAEYPEDRNKDISVRLGIIWKSMKMEEKDKYMDMARQADAEHKKKYPDYIYSPKEARVQKALRQVAHYLKVGKAIRSHKATTAVPAKRARSRHNPVSSRREEQMQILDMFPMSVAKFVGPVSVTTSAPATTIATQKARKSATSSHKSSKNSSASTQLTALEITSPLSDNSGVVSGAENTHSPLPAFKQAFGSTEIGCYSHEGFFNTTQQAENQQSISNEKPDPLEFKLPPYEFYVEGLLPEWEFMNEIIKFDSVACLDDRF